MARIGPLLAFSLLVCTSTNSVLADPNPMVSRVLAVQRAMLSAREFLAQGQPKEAVEALEAEILYVNGNGAYLALLREAYTAYLQELQLRGGENTQVEHLRKQLRILDPKGEFEKTVSAAPETPSPPPPPEPVPAAPVRRDPVPVPSSPERSQPAKPAEDPFEQEPVDRAQSASIKADAIAAFDHKQYPEADRLFAKAQQAREALSAEERSLWGYSKLHGLAMRLNQPSDNALSPAIMEQEARLAAELGGERLSGFAKQILGEIEKRKQTPAKTANGIPDGWATIETTNFRVCYAQNKELASEAARAAELARKTMFERWSGATPSEWSPRCDIWLHPTANDYAQATRKPAKNPGHSTVGVQANRVVSRRIDLRADDAGILDVTVPHEVTYVVLSDLFADQPLPRWAEVAITVLSEPRSQVVRYLRAVPRCAEEKSLLPVSQLLSMQDFPQQGALTAFYVESVSLTEFLVKQKGEKAFAIFLREAPRRGFEKALQTHYGFKDSKQLEESWLKHASGGHGQ